jgi:Fanconi anemia group M protein
MPPELHATNISVDDREALSGIPRLLEAAGFPVIVKRQLYADYVIEGEVAIERKTARDFLVSIVDGRLFRQLGNLAKFYDRPLLLIEGNPFKTELEFDPRAIRGAILSVQAVWNIPVIHSKDPEDTASVITTISGQINDRADVVLLRHGYRPKRLRSRQLYVLQGLPRVGPVLAKRLLEHFGTVARVMAGAVDAFVEVQGIAESTAKRIREVLDAEISPQAEH